MTQADKAVLVRPQSLVRFCSWSAAASVALAVLFGSMYIHGELALWAAASVAIVLLVTAIGFGKLALEIATAEPVSECDAA